MIHQPKKFAEDAEKEDSRYASQSIQVSTRSMGDGDRHGAAHEMDREKPISLSLNTKKI